MDYYYEEYHYGASDTYDVFAKTNFEFPYHFHRCFELISVTSGEVTMQVDHVEYQLSSGDTILIFPDQLHALQTPVSSEVFVIIFSPELIPDFTSEFSHCELESSIIRNHTISFAEAFTTNIYEQKALLYQLCGIYSKRPKLEKKKNRSDHLILLHTILTYLQKNYCSGCSLRELSTQTGYDYTYLSKYFEKKMGVTFTSFLNQLRIRQACIELKNTQDAISDIALSCGYETIRTFNRNFFSAMGITPSEFRTQRF